MSNAMYFVQECPTCGRRLQIRVEYLGKRVVCQHCQGKFEARDPATRRHDGNGNGNELLRRADELLESVSQEKTESRLPYPR